MFQVSILVDQTRMGLSDRCFRMCQRFQDGVLKCPIAARTLAFLAGLRLKPEAAAGQEQFSDREQGKVPAAVLRQSPVAVLHIAGFALDHAGLKLSLHSNPGSGPVGRTGWRSGPSSACPARPSTACVTANWGLMPEGAE